MARKTKRASKRPTELDSVYLLKIVLYLILGSQWLYIVNQQGTTQIPVPVGIIIGAFFVRHEHFSIDRKIEYAVLLVSMFIGFWLPMGITIVR